MASVAGSRRGRPAECRRYPRHFPRLVVTGRVALVTLCSGLPTWLFSAEGELGAAQLSRLDAMLSAIDRTAHLPVIAVHHPPHAPGLSPLKRLRDGQALMTLLARHRCPLVLHGHLHRACEATATIDGFAITLAGAPSASSAGHHGDDPAGYSLVQVDEALAGASSATPSDQGAGAPCSFPIGSAAAWCLDDGPVPTGRFP